MKFSFEKLTPKEEKITESELTQEQFDKQIIEEAEKLDTNINQLYKEIVDAGGPEKFKEWYSKASKRYLGEKEGKSYYKTTGAEVIKDHHDWSDSAKKNSNEALKLSAFIAIAGTLVTVAGIHEGQDTTVAIAELSVASFGTLISALKSLKEKINSKALERYAEKMDLKMKMTNTPYEIENKNL